MRDELDLFVSTEHAASVALELFLKSIYKGDRPDESRRLLQTLAEMPGHPAMSALNGYRRMRSILALTGATTKAERMGRFKTYDDCSGLLQLEMRNARRARFAKMVLSSDWSELGALCREAAETERGALMLWLGGLFYRLNIPGTLSLCDSAAYLLFAAFQRTDERNLERAA